MWDIVKEGVAVMFSAFAGASLAFIRERYVARIEKAKRDYAGLREAHFSLLQQHTQLVSIRDQYLVSAEAQTAAPWLTMRPTIGFLQAPRLEISRLLFLLEGPEPDILNRLLVAEQKYLALHAYLEQRNRAITELQDRISAAQREGTLATPSPVEDIEKHVGPAIIGRLKTITAAIFESYEGVIGFQAQQLADLSALSALLFPRRRVPKFELLPPEQRL